MISAESLSIQNSMVNSSGLLLLQVGTISWFFIHSYNYEIACESSLNFDWEIESIVYLQLAISIDCATAYKSKQHRFENS